MAAVIGLVREGAEVKSTPMTSRPSASGPGVRA